MLYPSLLKFVGGAAKRAAHEARQMPFSRSGQQDRSLMDLRCACLSDCMSRTSKTESRAASKMKTVNPTLTTLLNAKALQHGRC